MNLGNPGEALEMFRRTLEDRPDHAEAMDNAANCCFLLGSLKGGQRLAKEASNLGLPRTYDAWVKGKYTRRRPIAH
jgi:hypothetical protein